MWNSWKLFLRFCAQTKQQHHRHRAIEATKVSGAIKHNFKLIENKSSKLPLHVDRLGMEWGPPALPIQPECKREWAEKSHRFNIGKKNVNDNHAELNAEAKFDPLLSVYSWRAAVATSSILDRAVESEEMR